MWRHTRNHDWWKLCPTDMVVKHCSKSLGKQEAKERRLGERWEGLGRSQKAEDKGQAVLADTGCLFRLGPKCQKTPHPFWGERGHWTMPFSVSPALLTTLSIEYNCQLYCVGALWRDELPTVNPEDETATLCRLPWCPTLIRTLENGYFIKQYFFIYLVNTY